MPFIKAAVVVLSSEPVIQKDTMAANALTLAKWSRSEINESALAGN